MQGEKPAPGLIDTFGDKVCRKAQFLIDIFAMFEWIMKLSIGHSA